MPKAVKRGRVSAAEATVRRKRSKGERAKERAAYLKEPRDRAEWGIAMLRYCEAAHIPIVFRKADLIALRK